MFPVNVIAESPDPSPSVNDSPPVPLSENVPFVAVRETCRLEDPASISDMEICEAVELLNVTVFPVVTEREPGAELTGASLIAVTVICTVADCEEYAVVPPPEPGFA
jgi:hypothetical protein